MNKQITFIISQLGLGGAERVVSVLANGFSKMGIKVNIIAVVSDDISYKLDNKINYYYISSSIKYKSINTIDKVIKLRRLMKEIGKTDVISFLFVPILYSILANLFTKNKLYVSERNNPYMEPKSALYRKIRNISYYFADKIIFQTEEARKYFSKNIQKKGCIIPNPINDKIPSRFLGKRNKEIIAACRLDEQKNIKMMIDAFNKLLTDYSNYKLIVYGEGPQREELEKYIYERKLQNNIFLEGFCKNVNEKMNKAQIYVSSSNYEGISNSMLEALAMGIPSVVTDCPIGGARMYINNNVNGVLVPVGDTEKFYLGMKKIIEDEEFANNISNEAIKIRKKLNIDKILEMWLEQI